MAAIRTLVPGSVATSHDFGDITNTISMSSCHICRSWSTALPCKLQSGGWCRWLSRGIWWGEAEKRRFTLACLFFPCVPVVKASIPIVAPRSPCWTLHALCLSTAIYQCHEHYERLWLPLCECPTDTKQHSSGATKEHVAGLGLRILFKLWISWNELLSFYICVLLFLQLWFAYLAFHSPPENLYIYPPLFLATQNFWISALDCTVTFIQQPLTAHRQRPLLVWCGPPAQWTIFRTNKWPLI